MKGLKELTFYDYIILLIFGLFIVSGISIYGWYNEYTNNDKKYEYIKSEYDDLKNKESLLTNIIKSKEEENEQLNKLNDSLALKLVELNRKKEVNYNKYKNELKKNKEIINIKSANTVMDSILRTNHIR